jgi:hypothetical protein
MNLYSGVIKRWSEGVIEVFSFTLHSFLSIFFPIEQDIKTKLDCLSVIKDGHFFE